MSRLAFFRLTSLSFLCLNFSILAFAFPQNSQDATLPTILIDGYFEDWQGRAPLFVQTPADVSPEKRYLAGLWATDDADYLYLKLAFSNRVLLQENNRITLYIDTDDEPQTGKEAGAIGAEVAFTFGQRQGWMLIGEDSLSMEYEALGLVAAPATFADTFELALQWNASPELERLHFGNGPFRLLIRDEETGSMMPAVRYQPLRQGRTPLKWPGLEKADNRHLRLVTHNVNRRHLQPDKRDAFTRVYRALQPDLLLLEEAYDGTAEEIRDYFLPALGPSPTGQWLAYKAGAEATVLITPFPVQEVVPLGNSAAYLLDLRPYYSGSLALVALSLPCCRQDSARQAEADQIMAFVRHWRKTSGNGGLVEGTPIVLAGDANLVGYPEQLAALMYGRIQDTLTYGPAFLPDWDNSSFADLCPQQLQRPLTFTWRGKGFFPSRLDYILYSDSVLGIGRNFVFDTVGLPESLLKRYDIREQDAPNTYKHQPVVADLILSNQ